VQQRRRRRADRAEVENRWGQSIALPDVADYVDDDVYVIRIWLRRQRRELPIGNRTEVGRWCGQVRKVLAGVLS
jgi:hypothetical protein